MWEIMYLAAILHMLHLLSCVSPPSGLTSSVIVELVGSPCLVVETNVTLRCQPDGVPRSKVTWFRDNIQLMPSNPRYLISNDSDFTITIINVVGNDTGTYTCNAMNTLTNGTTSETRRDSLVFGIACGQFAVYCFALNQIHIFIHACSLSHKHTQKTHSCTMSVLLCDVRCSAPYHCSSH